MVTLSPETPGNETLRRRFRVHDERQLSARTTLLEADDTETGDPVRVELFDVGGADGADLTRKFRERLRAFEELGHPVLSSVLSGGMREGTAYAVTEPHHGAWVDDLIGERFQERVSRREALDIVDVLLEALEVLHAQGLVHGHIGPRTVTLADDGGVGLLLLTAPTGPGRDGADFGPQDDVAAVATLLEAMVTGTDAEGSLAGRDAVGGAISALVARGNDPDPRQRPADAAEYRTLLGQTVRSLPPAEGRHVARVAPADRGTSEGTSPPRRRTLLWAALALVVALVGGAVLWALTQQGAEPGGALMPDLVGVSPAEASDLLAELPVALEVTYRDVRSDDVEAGLVTASSPESGRELGEGAEVRLSVAAGPLTVLMPEVVGSLEQDAREALEEEGFTDVEVVQEPSEGLPAGTVTESDPQEGETVPHDAAVVLTVVEGVTVPDLVGGSEQEAVDTLAELGLESRVEDAAESERPSGEVESHTPGPGAVVDEGALVVLVISTGPEEDEEEDAGQEEDTGTEDDREEGQAAAPPTQEHSEEPRQEEQEQAAPCTSGGWSEGTTYPEGARVVHEGKEYEAAWWNSESSPSESNEWGPWRPVTSC
ncbi:PASTA domain-containing protein [Nocardiopsis sp. B62]|uniref:PASTA domain-containing protein n=1 Tax=Nocardiopsis sp. B62 TaxID=2824874 RepID=UPI001B37ED01|nr:PASTA domain-containing protein [Nocardiopsis sp. B62]MBQ1084409.1 PASTA domain-containing protein [Nocardiopsis sp. B62]